MKITAEPTTERGKNGEFAHPIVSIEEKSDDQTIEDLFNLFKRLALAMGYHPKNVAEYFDNENEEE